MEIKSRDVETVDCAAVSALPKPRLRHHGIELGRLLGCYAVILIHQRAQFYGDAVWAFVALNQIARWAVPFYFIMSGYFLASKAGWFRIAWRSLSRIVPIYAFWFVAYMAVYWPVVSLPFDAASLLKVIMNGGRGFHLWFLFSLCLCVVVIAPLLAKEWRRAIVAIGALTFAIGLLAGPYSPAVCGGYGQCVPFNPRNGVTFGLLFVALGVALRAGWFEAWRSKGLWIAALGVSLSFVEVYALKSTFGISLTQHDFVLGTVPFALGLALFFLGLDLKRGRLAKLVDFLGPISLGVYVVHVMVLEMLAKALEPHSLIGGVAFSWLVFAISIAIAFIGVKTPLVRRVFT